MIRSACGPSEARLVRRSFTEGGSRRARASDSLELPRARMRERRALGGGAPSALRNGGAPRALINADRFRTLAAALAMVACGILPVQAQEKPQRQTEKQEPPPPGTPKDFTIPTPRRFTLANGLPVTLVPFGQVPKVNIRLVVAAANLHEKENEVWLADLTGSLMREGTTALTAEAVAREFADMGGELGISVGPDTTSISTDVLSDRGADAIQLIADVAQRPRLPESEIERLKSDLLRTLSIQRSTPQAIAQEKFSELLYGDHPYGRIFPDEATLKGYTIEQVKAFHRDNYGAGRARLYVAGVFDAKTMEAAIRQAFEKWERGSAADLQKVPPPGDTRFALLDRPDAPQSTLMLGLRVPDPSHKDWVPLQVTDALLGGAFGSRITSNIREQKGYTYSPFSAVQTHPKQAHWVETADVTTKVTGESIKEIFFEIERLRKEAPPAPELRGIQNNLAGIFVVQNASRSGVISRLAFVDQHGLGDEYLSTYVKQVMAVTPADVQRVASQYLVPDKMTLVVLGDVKTVKDQVGPWATR
jgi:zinc protease